MDATPSNVDDSGISDSILDSPKDFKPRKTPQVTTTSETDITKQADQSKDQSKLVNQSKELANQSKVYSSKQGYKRKQKVDSDMALEVISPTLLLFLFTLKSYSNCIHSL